jgi:transposase
MEHIAIDLGGRESQVCIRGVDGTIVREGKHPTARLEEVFKGREKSRVILETSAEAFRVADAARRAGHEVRVVPATLVRLLGVGARGIKTDQRDARALSEASRKVDLPSVHIPSERARELKLLSAHREAQVRARTLLVNNVRGTLRSRHDRPKTGGVESFPTRVRKLLERSPEGYPASLERSLKAIEALTELIDEANRELEGIAEADPVCRRLMTIPGVGPVTAVRFVATIDVVSRFKDAHSVAAYAGLTPGENSSSERIRRTGITKAGSPQLRWALVQASWCLLRTSPHSPIAIWAKQIEGRRGKSVAIVAVARKLTGIMYAMWRDATDYNPARTAKVTA